MTTKTALITGVSRPTGLGFAVARRLARLGHHVILTARDVSRAEPLAARLRAEGHRATTLRLDLTEAVGMDEAAAHLTRTVGHLDVLINNACDAVDFTVLSALDADVDAVRSALEVDVLGPWRLVQSLLPCSKPPRRPRRQRHERLRAADRRRARPRRRPPRNAGKPATAAEPTLARLVTDLSPLPAMLLNHRFDILAWNGEMTRLPLDFATLPRRGATRCGCA
ncbi:SDR family NAD(P)-dependent oxidoreductase [Streptomyces sp. M19]